MSPAAPPSPRRWLPPGRPGPAAPAACTSFCMSKIVAAAVHHWQGASGAVVSAALRTCSTSRLHLRNQVTEELGCLLKAPPADAKCGLGGCDAPARGLLWTCSWPTGTGETRGGPKHVSHGWCWMLAQRLKSASHGVDAPRDTEHGRARLQASACAAAVLQGGSHPHRCRRRPAPAGPALCRAPQPATARACPTCSAHALQSCRRKTQSWACS